jgi:hypothetical protein
MNEIISVYISKNLRKKIDLKRGNIPRSRFLSGIIEKAIRGDDKK